MLDIFNYRTTNDYSFLNKFYKYFIPENFSAFQKKKILYFFFKLLNDQTRTINEKVNASKYLICPMLIKSFKNEQVS